MWSLWTKVTCQRSPAPVPRRNPVPGSPLAQSLARSSPWESWPRCELSSQKVCQVCSPQQIWVVHFYGYHIYLLAIGFPPSRKSFFVKGHRVSSLGLSHLLDSAFIAVKQPKPILGVCFNKTIFTKAGDRPTYVAVSWLLVSVSWLLV